MRCWLLVLYIISLKPFGIFIICVYPLISILRGYQFVQDIRMALGISTFDDDEGEKDKKAIVSRNCSIETLYSSSLHLVLSAWECAIQQTLIIFLNRTIVHGVKTALRWASNTKPDRYFSLSFMHHLAIICLVLVNYSSSLVT